MYIISMLIELLKFVRFWIKVNKRHVYINKKKIELL